MVAVLDEATQGNLEGLLAADARCVEAGVAAGLPGNWKAMLSTASRHLRDVVAPEDAAKPVVNLAGETMFASWSAMFSDQTIPEGVALLRFDGTPHEDALFTGTKADGTHSGRSCLDWTSVGHWGLLQWFDHHATAGELAPEGPRALLDAGEESTCTASRHFACVLVPPSDDVERCPDGFPRGARGEQQLAQPFSPSIEGVAVCPNGDVFVSQPEGAKIFRVPVDGAPPELWTTLVGRQPLGMDCGSDGALYVADFGSQDAGVLRVLGKDDPGTKLPALPGGGGYKAMNGVAAVAGVGVYATDASNTLQGRVVLFRETSPSVFAAEVVKSGLPFPNDVAFNPTTGALDVTMTVNSQVFSYPIGQDGALGKLGITWSGTLAVDAVDGLAVAESNDRYVAHHLEGRVRRTSDGQSVAELAEPRSLAFRGGTLFVTGREGLFSVDLGVCGAAR